MGFVASLSPGSIFAGDFRVIQPLREGGMGAVYLVEQVSTGAERALKLMHPELVSDDTMRRRFETEAKVGSRIQSDHVVQVLAAGVDAPTGVPWMAMELLKGEDLARRLHRGPVELEEAATILEQVCHALGAAHAVGIVHRDLKPENVFLAEARSVSTPSVVKLLDFGIAKVAAAHVVANTDTIGTPYWMAPEQTALGEAIVPATDVWAIGLLAFRMLTGRCFWKAAEMRAGSEVLLREMLLDDIPAASQRAAEYGVAPRIPPGFDAWFARCVARDSTARIPDAWTAWSELRPVLLAGPPPEPSTARLDDRGGDSAPTRPYRGGSAARSLGPASRPVAPSASGRGAVSAPGVVPARSYLGAIAGGVILAALMVVLGVWAVRYRASRATASVAPPEPGASASASAPPSASAVALGDLTDPVARIAIPGGTFSMGSTDGEDDERPVHPVTLQPFELDVTEVTVAAFLACVGAGRCSAPHEGEGCNRADRPEHPVRCVDFNQASTYCRAHGKRLPTEEEWEYAARGSQGRRHPWGPAPPVRQPCWNGEGNVAGKGRRDGPCPVGSSTGDRTPTGVLDMAGNVSEWTASHYCPYPIANCASPLRATRGATWGDFSAAMFHATYRGRSAPSEHSASLGFRCARTP